jgi:hypothetical protein
MNMYLTYSFDHISQVETLDDSDMAVGFRVAWSLNNPDCLDRLAWSLVNALL